MQSGPLGGPRLPFDVGKVFAFRGGDGVQRTLFQKQGVSMARAVSSNTSLTQQGTWSINVSSKVEQSRAYRTSQSVISQDK
jgi:hypothetical protein